MLIFFADGLPEDFSIIATVRPKIDNRGFLFTIYSGLTSRESLGLESGRDPMFIYEDQDGRPGKALSPRFPINTADGE